VREAYSRFATLGEGGTPLPLFFAKSNKHASKNEHVCKKRAQNLDVKELTNQNPENKGLRMF
jgi:hypothetical protein